MGRHSEVWGVGFGEEALSIGCPLTAVWPSSIGPTLLQVPHIAKIIKSRSIFMLALPLEEKTKAIRKACLTGDFLVFISF